MNKSIFKVLLAFILILVFSVKVNALEYTNEETGYKILIEDDADLLSNEEEEKLKEDMMPLTNYGHIAFKSINHNSTSTSSYANSYYHNKFGTYSGTVFIIDMDNRKIYIFSDGSNYRVITTAKANIITDNIYRYASREEYYECASEAYSQMETLLAGGKISEPMRYISNTLIAISVSLLISYIIVLANTKIKKASLNEILKKCNINLEVGDVTALKVGTHRVYSPRSDSSSGGGSSGGGGGGGGGSSGGGGGHSF